MPISYKKNRAMNRILRNKFHAAPALRLRAEPETAAPASYPLSAEIPKSYNDTYVRAIPKDPQSTFIYWEMPKKEAANNGIETNGKIHAGNGEAEAIQNKVNGGARGGGNDGNNQANRQNNDSRGNNNRVQNQGQYYDFESGSWRSGDNIQTQWDNNGGGRDNIPQRYENATGGNQPYHNDSDNSGQNAQHQSDRQYHQDYGGAQTYQFDDNGRVRNWRHRRHGHDNQQYYGNPEYYHILTGFTPHGNMGGVYLETSGIVARTTVLTAEYSALLDNCKSQVSPDIAGYSIVLDIYKSQVCDDAAVMANLSSGALYKKTAAAPPPNLSSGILYGRAGQQ